MGTHIAPMVVLWCVVIGRVSMLRRPGSSRVLWVALAFLAGAETLQVRAVYQWVNDLAGSPVAGSSVKIALAVGAAAGVRTLIAELTGRSPQSMRRDWVVAGLVTIIISLPAMVASPRHISAVVLASTEFYDAGWRSLVHWLPFLAFLAWALGGGVVLCWRYGRRAPSSPLRTGLTLIGTGCAMGFVYIGLKLGVLWAWHADPGGAADWTRIADGSIGSAVLAVCIIVIAVGCAWEALAAKWAAARNWLWAWWSLRRLQPLWGALVAVDPAVPLVAGRAKGSERRIRFRLIRRVVEIRDGLVVVADHADPVVMAEARRRFVAAGEGDEAADAMVVAVMVRRAAAGTPPNGAPGGAARPQPRRSCE